VHQIPYQLASHFLASIDCTNARTSATAWSRWRHARSGRPPRPIARLLSASPRHRLAPPPPQTPLAAAQSRHHPRPPPLRWPPPHAKAWPRRAPAAAPKTPGPALLPRGRAAWGGPRLGWPRRPAAPWLLLVDVVVMVRMRGGRAFDNRIGGRIGGDDETAPGYTEPNAHMKWSIGRSTEKTGNTLTDLSDSSAPPDRGSPRTVCAINDDDESSPTHSTPPSSPKDDDRVCRTCANSPGSVTR
jgi:hypothetical protein